MKIEIPSTFLSADDIEDGEEIQLMDEGEWKELPKQYQTPERKEVLQFQVKLSNGDEKILSLNLTSMKALTAEYGSDSLDWIKKPVKILLVTQNIQGELKKVIYVVPPAWDTPTSPKEDAPKKGKKIDKDSIPVIKED